MEGRGQNGEGGIEQREIPSDAGASGTEPENGDSDERTDEQDEDELLKNEDAIQTAARLLGKQGKEEAGVEESFEEASVSDGTNQESTERASSDKKDKGGVEDEDVEPPIRLSAEAKTAFKSWPKKAKQEFSTAVKNLEGAYNRSNQEAVHAKKEAEHVLQAVRPYYTSKPELASKGISEAQMITALVGNHQLLTHDDVNVRRAKYIAIGKSIGLVDNDGQFVDAPDRSSTGASSAAITEAINSTLQTRLAPIESFLESQRRGQQEKAADAAVAEIKSVMEEKDGSGRLLYPELQDSEFHMQQVKPLVVGLVRSIPDLSWGQAARMAVQHFRLKNGKSNQSNPTRLPTNNESHRERAAEAGVSARGKAAGGSSVESLTPLQQRIMSEYPVGGR